MTLVQIQREHFLAMSLKEREAVIEDSKKQLGVIAASITTAAESKRAQLEGYIAYCRMLNRLPVRLTVPQARDLLKCVEQYRYYLENTTNRFKSVRLRTGHRLASLGLVESNRSAANQYDHWFPTPAGISWAEQFLTG